MSINEIDKKLILLGNGLLHKKKYDFYFKLDQPEFFKLIFTKKRIEQYKINDKLYKPL